jgi:hypothetical protein
MNCWIWILLLWCFFGNTNNGNGCQNNGCGETQGRSSMFPPPPPPSSGCGCGNGVNSTNTMQPRPFAGFGDNNTCGCEEKKEN